MLSNGGAALKKIETTSLPDLSLSSESSSKGLSSSDIVTFFKNEKEEKKILLVEDDISQIELIEELINELNPDTSVDWYFSAEEALVKLEEIQKLKNERDYDLIIADIFLKGFTNGLDLWGYCKKYYPSSKVLVISSFDEDTLQEVFSGEFDDIHYIQKPLNFNQFAAEVKPLITKKKKE